MESLWRTLIVFAVVTFSHPFSYMIAEKWYRNNPEYQKEKMFLQLEALFGRKYVKFGFFAASAIFCAASFFVQVKFL